MQNPAEAPCAAAAAGACRRPDLPAVISPEMAVFSVARIRRAALKRNKEVTDMKTVRKLVALALAVMLALSLACTAPAAGTLSQSVQKSAQYLLSAVPDPQVGGVGGEWAVLGLARSGASVPDSYFSTYYRNVERYVRECRGVLHERKYTEYSRVIIALTAIGKDPTNVAGYNLLTPLGDYDQTVWQGVNGPMWALIALDCGGYDMPKNTQAKTQATRQMYVDLILGAQLSDGGWTIGGDEADPDLTAMALQALAPYRGQKAVRSAVNDGIACLSKLQGSTGGYESWGTANSESAAQVVVALTTLDIPLDDSRFVKGGKTVLDALLTYQNTDGSFRHTADGTADGMATEQGFYALAAALRAQNGQSALYQMQVDASSAEPSNPDKNAAVKSVPVTKPDVSFSDVKNHKNQAAIEELASRGIINGTGSGLFQPDRSMTRAEFAAIVTRGLGLTPGATSAFTDVPADQWYAGYIGTASSYGIVNGVGNRKFNPSGTITRQEAAAMVARAAKLCGMDTALTASASEAELAKYDDGRLTADWAKQPVAFCLKEGILTCGKTISPTQPILRCEIAQMLYNLLKNAELL